MRLLVWVLAGLLAAGSSVAANQNKGKGRGANAQANAEKGRGNQVAPANVFRTEDRTVIAEYYRSRPGGLPPGLAKRGDLPPGLEKQLRRNGTLPPGLQKRVTPFPAELEVRLPPCPVGVRRGLLGGVAVMWSSKSGLILDAAAVLGL